MTPRETVERLTAVQARAACSDAERRAAADLRDQLRAGGRAARLETVWVRPQWPALHAWHCAIAVGAILAATRFAAPALAVLVLVLASMTGSLTGRFSLLGLLARRRATQNVVSEAPPHDERIRLLVTASTDAGRTGAIYGALWTHLETAVRRRLRGHGPSAFGLLSFCVALLGALAAVRVAGLDGRWIGAAAIGPAVICILGFGVLVDIAHSPVSPGANANASGVAVALALVAALDRRPPRNVAVELVLAGAGEGMQAGFAAHVRSRRGRRRPEDMAVLALGPCGAGRPRFAVSEGLLAPLRLHPLLIAHARACADAEPHLAAKPIRRGFTGAWAARLGGWPALSVSSADEHDRPPGARTAHDTSDAIDDDALNAAVEFCLAVVARLDAELGRLA